jgi:hypothetical protein
MKKKKITVLCYLRTHRRVWGLSVKELTSLVGLQSAAHMSRACQVIFGIPPSAMFPHVYTRVEDRVMWNIHQLHLALENTTSLSAQRKRELFEVALKRATDKSAPDEGL